MPSNFISASVFPVVPLIYFALVYHANTHPGHDGICNSIQSPFVVESTSPFFISTLYSSNCKHALITLFFSIVTHEFDSGSFPLNDNPNVFKSDVL